MEGRVHDIMAFGQYCLTLGTYNDSVLWIMRTQNIILKLNIKENIWNHLTMYTFQYMIFIRYARTKRLVLCSLPSQ